MLNTNDDDDDDDDDDPNLSLARQPFLEMRRRVAFVLLPTRRDKSKLLMKTGWR